VSSIINAKGLEAGERYMVQWLRMLVWAERTGNEEAAATLTHIAAIVLKELADEFGDLKQSATAALVTYMITGRHDPMEGSRHETQAAIARWKADSDAWWHSLK